MRVEEEDASERLIMSRLVRGAHPGREFDVEFWQKLGPTKIFQAAWELVVIHAKMNGIDESQLRMDKSVVRLTRRNRTHVDEEVPG